MVYCMLVAPAHASDGLAAHWTYDTAQQTAANQAGALCCLAPRASSAVAVQAAAAQQDQRTGNSQRRPQPRSARLTQAAQPWTPGIRCRQNQQQALGHSIIRVASQTGMDMSRR
jgi:hypothetical protein